MSTPSFVLAAVLAFLSTMPLMGAAPAVPTKGESPRVDCFGDSLPPGAVARLGTMRLHYSHAAAFSPDGKTLATAGIRFLRLWDLATGKEVRRLDMPAYLVSTRFPTPTLAFSRDGRTVAVCHEVGIQLAVWRVDHPRPLFSSFVRRNGVGHSLQSSRILFSADGKTLFTGNDRSVHGWDTATGQERFQLQHSKKMATRVSTVVFSCDGKHFATASTEESEVRVWDTKTGRQLHVLHGPKGYGTHCVAFNHDGSLLATGGDDHMVHLWDMKRGKEIRTLDGPLSKVVAVAFSSDGKELAIARVGRESSTIHLWEIGAARRRPRKVLAAPGVTALEYSPDGKTLAWIYQGQMVRLLDTATGVERLPFASHSAWVNAIAYAPDGRLIVTGSDDSTIRLWEADTGKLRGVLHGHKEAVSSLAFSPDGQWLASASADKTAMLWNVAKRDRRFVIDGHGTAVRLVAFTPDGRSLIVGGADQVLHHHDVRTGKETRKTTRVGPLRRMPVTLSPDGTLLARGGKPDEEDSDAFLVQEADNGKQLLSGNTSSVLTSLAFSPDGRTLVSGCLTETILWELASGKERARLLGLGSRHGGLLFSADGKRLACGGFEVDSDRSWPVAVWELTTGRQLAAFDGHEEVVRALAFAPDGKRLVTSSDDGTTLVWDLDASARRGPHPLLSYWPTRRTLTAKDLEDSWAKLAGADAFQAQQAIWSLAGAPGLSIPSFRTHLPAATAPARVAALIADLDSDSYRTRQKANAELAALGPLAEPQMRKKLTEKPSLEVRRRIELLLRMLPKKNIQAVRAVEALEQMGTPEAIALLRRLADGPKDARMTQEAKGSLERLSRRARP
jgi:WD40 repeat protein